jgi:hypothetical protein
MDSMDNLLVSFHGRGKHLNKAHQVMTYLMLLFFPTILSWLLTKLAEASHDLTRHWEWNHVCLMVHHHPRKHPQEEESKTAKQEQRPSTKEKVFHPNLPSTSGPYCLQGLSSS